MPEYNDTDRGVLWKNKTKKTDKHPDYTGKLNVGGKDMQIAGWIKKGAKGSFLSLKVSELREQSTSQQPSARGASSPDDDLDRIPF